MSEPPQVARVVTAAQPVDQDRDRIALAPSRRLGVVNHQPIAFGQLHEMLLRRLAERRPIPQMADDRLHMAIAEKKWRQKSVQAQHQHFL